MILRADTGTVSGMWTSYYWRRPEWRLTLHGSSPDHPVTDVRDLVSIEYTGDPDKIPADRPRLIEDPDTGMVWLGWELPGTYSTDAAPVGPFVERTSPEVFLPGVVFSGSALAPEPAGAAFAALFFAGRVLRRGRRGRR